ncbi:MATE efflux family protein [Patellaria atrata CBS 101060]|uniref:MATE efflux family protein n=1 Tax=Patellaria atrata CBS 101060 TaxID=1346257 RepID=A0A9P4SA73_9PEZI|nr:MATE efflux family protein [Patellaria atrata CBS 101060]
MAAPNTGILSEITPLLPSHYDTQSRTVQTDCSPKHEVQLLLGYSIPLVGTYLLQYFYNLIIILVASRLSTKELAGVSIGITTMNITGFAIFEGMTTSLDTLCSQAYGSGNLKLVGLHVQRMVLLQLLVSVPVGTLWICSPWILKRVVFQEDAAILAGSFLRITLIGLPGYAIFEAGKRFAQAQGNFTASLVSLLVCAPANLFLNWLLVFHFDLGVTGAALAAALTNNLRPVFLVLHLRFISPWTLQCWPGFTGAVFRNWGPMIQLSIPGAAMTLCEWFAFEILTFSTSYLSTAHIAAQTLLCTCEILVWHIPFSVSTAMTTRIGQLIGAGAVDTARKAVQTYTIVFAVIGIMDTGLLIFVVTQIINPFFIRDQEVRDLVDGTMYIISAFQFSDASACCTQGIMRGLGKQLIAGWVTFGVNYLWALPLALFLELGPPGLGLKGIWSSLAGCVFLLTAAEAAILKMMNWDRAALEAKEREHSDTVEVDEIGENLMWR